MAKQMNIGSSSSSVDVNVVNGKLQQGGKQVVLKVNNTEPDANGNVTITVGGSVPTNIVLYDNDGNVLLQNDFAVNGDSTFSGDVYIDDTELINLYTTLGLV